MSQHGIKIMAEVFSFIQQKRDELLAMGCKRPSTFEGKQDIKLGQLCEDMKDATKERFCRITVEKGGGRTLSNE